MINFCIQQQFQIELGSTNVRVGSTIFGAREPKVPSKSTASGSQEASAKIESEKGPQTVSQNNNVSQTVTENLDDKILEQEVRQMSLWWRVSLLYEWKWLSSF